MIAMKTQRLFFLIMMVLSIAIVSCDKDDDKETCDSEDLSEDFGCPTDVDAIATFCSDGVNDSYYTFNGNDYMCTGVDVSTCDDALNQIGAALIEAGCGSKKSGSIEKGMIELSAMAERLLSEVRTESLCD